MTLILSIADMGNFSLSQFHSHFLPNDLAFWQFFKILEMFRDSGKLPKYNFIWQKMAVELTILWGRFFVPKFFLAGLCIKEVLKKLWAKNPMTIFYGGTVF